jgi:hypothetical protein
MENQTPSDLNFDLNRAVLAWKSELAGEPGVSAENVRELEVHLLESIAALKGCGLNDQEAFLKARQQLGSMSKIGAEFAKDNPLRIWRDRVFWAAIAGFLLQVTQSAIITHLLHPGRLWYGMWVATVLNFTPVFVAVPLLATGWIQLIYSRVSWLFISRWRLGIAGLLLTVVASFGGSFIGPFAIRDLGFLLFAVVMMPREMLTATHVKIESATNWRNSTRLWRDRLFWIAASILALGVWNRVVTVGTAAYIHSLPESKSSLLAGIIWFLVWGIPMAVVGIALSMGRLSWATRALQSRSGILIAGSGLLLVSNCLLLWWYHPVGHVPSMSQAAWWANIFYNAVPLLIVQAGLIATMLWLLPQQQRMSAVRAA